MTVQCSASVDDIIKPFKLQVFFSIFIIIVSICGNACFVPQDVASERSKPCRISPVPTSPSRPKPSAAPPPRRSCPGVRAAQTQRRGFAVTQVEVLDATGSEALCKPIGRYDTLDLTPLLRRADDAFENAAQTLSELLRAALPLMPEASVLVVGLGQPGDHARCRRTGRHAERARHAPPARTAARAIRTLSLRGGADPRRARHNGRGIGRARPRHDRPPAPGCRHCGRCARLRRAGAPRLHRPAHRHRHHARQRRRQRPRGA